MKTDIVVSIIIPTHNRSASLKRLLQKLAMQSYPLENMEVIAVANSCTDDTVNLLQQYKAPFQLRFAETSGSGPAVPRNTGAAMAEGSILIFLDDDVEPSEELVAAYVDAHKDENTVVVGYLPLTMPKKPGFFRLSLRHWWEKKFDNLRHKGYRFTYEDVLSGNFSLPASLFKKAAGFITSFNCRDDYELGLRLIKLGAAFCFSEEAWAFHRDEVTTLQRSLRRKREEGKTDVKLWRLHPDLTNGLQDSYAKGEYTFLQSKTVAALLFWPALTDRVFHFLGLSMDVLEQLKLRSLWHKLSYKIHLYWYYRGLLEELQTKKKPGKLPESSDGAGSR